MNPENGLTVDEQEIMGMLILAWNTWCDQFVSQGRVSTVEKDTFRKGMHMMQEVFAQRALHRTYPMYWNEL